MGEVRRLNEKNIDAWWFYAADSGDQTSKSNGALCDYL